MSRAHSVRVGYHRMAAPARRDHSQENQLATLQQGCPSGDLRRRRKKHPARAVSVFAQDQTRATVTLSAGAVGSGQQLRAGRGQRRVENVLLNPAPITSTRRREVDRTRHRPRRASATTCSQRQTALSAAGEVLVFAPTPPFTSRLGGPLVATVTRKWTRQRHRGGGLRLLNNAARARRPGRWTHARVVIATTRTWQARRGDHVDRNCSRCGSHTRLTRRSALQQRSCACGGGGRLHHRNSTVFSPRLNRNHLTTGELHLMVPNDPVSGRRGYRSTHTWRHDDSGTEFMIRRAIRRGRPRSRSYDGVTST